MGSAGRSRGFNFSPCPRASAFLPRGARHGTAPRDASAGVARARRGNAGARKAGGSATFRVGTAGLTRGAPTALARRLDSAGSGSRSRDAVRPLARRHRPGRRAGETAVSCPTPELVARGDSGL